MNNINKNDANVFSNYIEGEKIKIGDTFMIYPEFFQRFSKTAYCMDGEFGLGYDRCEIAETSYLREMLFLVKYIGNGILQELVSGEKIRFDGNGDGNFSFEDVDERSVALDGRSVALSEITFDAVPFKNDIERFMKTADYYKSVASDTPIIYGGNIVEIDDDILDEYNEYDDEERIKAINYVKSIAEKSREEVLKDIDKAVAYYSSAGSIEMTGKTK